MTGMMNSPTATIGWLCDGVRRMLSQNLNDELTFTAAPYTPGDTTLSLTEVPRRVGPGSILSWHDNTLYVRSVSSSSAAVEVIGGYDGGPGSPMLAGTPVRVNPRFTDYTLFEQVSAVIGSLSSPVNGLYSTATQTVTGMHSDDFYPVPVEIADTVLKVLRVESRLDGSHDWIRSVNWQASLTQGNQFVRIFSDAVQHQITYAVKITKPVAFTDDAVVDCGMTDSMLDLPVLGAAAVLMQGQEARRVNQRAQGDPRRSEDVPITGAISTARELQRMFRDRLDEEYAKIVQANPYGMKAV